jgi:hypothetical protein
MATDANRSNPAKDIKSESVSPQYRAFKDLLRKVVKPANASALRPASSRKG